MRADTWKHLTTSPISYPGLWNPSPTPGLSSHTWERWYLPSGTYLQDGHYHRRWHPSLALSRPLSPCLSGSTGLWRNRVDFVIRWICEKDFQSTLLAASEATVYSRWFCYDCTRMHMCVTCVYPCVVRMCVYSGHTCVYTHMHVSLVVFMPNTQE